MTERDAKMMSELAERIETTRVDSKFDTRLIALSDKERDLLSELLRATAAAPIAELRAEVASLREANKTFADHAIHGNAPSVGMPIDPPHAVISVAMQEIPEDGCEYEHIEAAYRAMRVALSSTDDKLAAGIGPASRGGPSPESASPHTSAEGE